MDNLELTVPRVIRDIWLLADEMQFKQVRVDRAQFGDDRECYIEVGYASEEIHIRTSVPKLRLRRGWESVDMNEVVGLLKKVIDHHYPEEEI